MLFKLALKESKLTGPLLVESGTFISILGSIGKN